MKCPICDETSWKSLDGLRDAQYWWNIDRLDIDKPLGFMMCLKCGFLTYDQYESEEKIKDFYRTKYRNAVMPMNHVTCNRKNMYHKAFLHDRLKVWAAEGKSFLDVGCAQGSLLKFLRDEYGFKNENLAGTEWTIGFRNFATKEYGLNVTEDWDTNKKYDIISMYRVLEHVWEPDKKLAQLRDMLSDKGLLYISVPVWLGLLEDPPGAYTNDFENLFHLNHCQVFTDKTIQMLFAKVGLKAIWTDKTTYGYTVLLEKCGKEEKAVYDPDYPAQVEKDLEKQVRAVKFLAEGKPAEAVATWAHFPDAWCAFAGHKENARDKETIKTILENGLKATNNHVKVMMAMAMMYLQFGGGKRGDTSYSNDIKQGEKWLLKVLAMRGGEDVYHSLAVIEYVYKKNEEKAVEYWKEVMKINPMRYQECWSFIGHVRGGMALPENRGEERPRIEPTPVTMVVQPKLKGLAQSMGAREA